MKTKYLKYNLEELIEDKDFIAWVIRGEKKTEWELFGINNPGFREKANKGREIILLLQDSFELIDEESVIEIWHNIDRFDRQFKQKVKKIKQRKFILMAASVLIVIAMGTLAYFHVNNEKNYQFVADTIQNKSNGARLVLSGGEEIALQKNNSFISLNKANEIIIDNDSIIDLSKKQVMQQSKVQMNEVIIPFGKKSELLLADGTKVWLNAGSQLAFPTSFSGNTRKVFLKGEAYFEVTKQANHPFIVIADGVDIEVIGTHFDVSAYPSDEKIETVLIEGSVVVSTKKAFGIGEDKVLLKSYQRANFNKKSKKVEVLDEPNADVFIAWTEGWLQFSKEDLKSVFTKLERYYNVKINLPQDFPSTEITGKLDLKDSLADVMIALSDVAKIEYNINDREVNIDKMKKELVK